MLELMTIIGAFFLYLLVLPLTGLVSAVCCRVVLPYLAGGVLIYGVLGSLLGGLGTLTLLFSALLIWCLPVLCVRYWPSHNGVSLSWHQGHYRAALSVLSFGLYGRQENTAAAEHGLSKLAAKLRID